MEIFKMSSQIFQISLRRLLFITCGLITLSFDKVTSQVTCVRSGSCKCVLSNGRGELDLTPLSGNTTHPKFSEIPGDDGDKYWFDPCVDFSLSEPSNNSEIVNSCTDVRVCRYSVSEDKYLNCGTSEPDYLYNEQNNSITLVYNNSEAGVLQKFTSVVLKCINSTKDSLCVNGNDTSNPKFYNMTLESQYGCLAMNPTLSPSSSPSPTSPTSSPSHRVSVGTMVIVILLSGIILYCGVGCLFHRTVHGAQGTDQIPHYAFWSSIPGLIKDGWLFATERCRQKKDPEGYDSL